MYMYMSFHADQNVEVLESISLGTVWFEVLESIS
jgi:hypothetical protein